MLNHQSPRQASRIATTAPLGLLVGAFALFGWQAYHSMRVCHFTLVDDAYISLRYAWQWVNGAGIVWQPGDRVEGYTNFLQVALLAWGCDWASMARLPLTSSAGQPVLPALWLLFYWRAQ